MSSSILLTRTTRQIILMGGNLRHTTCLLRCGFVRILVKSFRNVDMNFRTYFFPRRKHGPRTHETTPSLCIVHMLSRAFMLPTLPQDTFGSVMVISQVSGYSKQFLFCHNKHLEITLKKLLCFYISAVIFESLRMTEHRK